MTIIRLDSFQFTITASTNPVDAVDCSASVAFNSSLNGIRFCGPAPKLFNQSVFSLYYYNFYCVLFLISISVTFIDQCLLISFHLIHSSWLELEQIQLEAETTRNNRRLESRSMSTVNPVHHIESPAVECSLTESPPLALPFVQLMTHSHTHTHTLEIRIKMGKKRKCIRVNWAIELHS